MRLQHLCIKKLLTKLGKRASYANIINMKLFILGILLCSSGCGVLMGTVVAPLYYYKEEVIKPKPLSVVQLEAKREREEEQQ